MCVNGVLAIMMKSYASFTGVEIFHVVTQHVVKEAEFTVLGGGDE